jgi:nitroimidazol reductase NimA-like FMN-containing flavoprotein (pyridoxamine 5'-phosphate oxidase superfamily)
MTNDQIAESLNRPLSQEMLARDLCRLAYVAKDGTPRSIPIAFAWNGKQAVMCSRRHSR